MSEYQIGDRVCFTDYAWSQYSIDRIKKGSDKATVLSFPSPASVKVERDGVKNPITYHRKYWKLDNDISN